MTRFRIILFTMLAGLCVLATAGYVMFKISSRQAAPARAVASLGPETLQAIVAPHIVFVDTSEPTHMRLAAAPLDAPNVNRFVTSVPCDRVYFAGDRGLARGRRSTTTGIGASLISMLASSQGGGSRARMACPVGRGSRQTATTDR